MHPMKIGLGLALLLHVAAGLSPHAKKKLAAFRAQLEAKEAGAVAQDNPKGKGLIMPGKLPKGKGLIMPGKLPGAVPPGAIPTPGLPDDTSTQDSNMSSTTDDAHQPQVDIMP